MNLANLRFEIMDASLKNSTNPYLSEIKSLRRYITPIPFVLLPSYLFYIFGNGDTIITWGKEDSFFEWLTSFFYFISSLLLALTYKKNRNIFLLLLGILMFFGACEEISWGQRVFGIATPENIRQINVQRELNIHNLAIFDGKHMDGEPKQGIAKLLSMDSLFKIFTGVFGILLPLFVYHSRYFSTLAQKLKLPVPPISIGIFFVISWLGLKLGLSTVPAEDNIEHYWRVYMAGPEIAEFIASFIMMTICLYFYNHRSKNIMGKDFKQL